LLSAALAFRLFLWMLPAALVGVGVLGFFEPGDTAGTAESVGLGRFAVSQVEQATVQAQRARWVALILGVVLLYFASLSLVRALVLAITLTWKMPPRRLANPLRAAAVLNAAMVAGVLFDAATLWLRQRSPGLGLGALLAAFLVWILLWWAVSMLLPHPAEVGRLHLLPGALVFGVGLYALHLASVLYLSNRVATASKLYGTLGGAATLLLWAFLLCRLVVASAAVNAIWFARGAGHAGSPGHPTPPPQR
jgi:uncharacterized BrkB/YihY/UPF0761 family membrane protein